MGWTGIDHQGEVTIDAVLKGWMEPEDVVDAAMFKDYVFVAWKVPSLDGEVLGAILFFQEHDGMLFVKPIDEGMGIMFTPTGPDARRVAAKLTKGDFADMRWRASIFS